MNTEVFWYSIMFVALVVTLVYAWWLSLQRRWAETNARQWYEELEKHRIAAEELSEAYAQAEADAQMWKRNCATACGLAHQANSDCKILRAWIDAHVATTASVTEIKPTKPAKKG